ncbi:MAG: FprA family A-type flavoprotein [Candidatus Altiarchaeota archaeon]|nr:FprA family A-type flavoprotein [Candidatus Altiarchaeota archaeon]
MAVRELRPGVLSLSALDWNRRLFDSLIPLPDGTTYNAYIITGSKATALIDSSDPAKERELLENLKNAGVGRIDYIIANHAEQDHSGAIPAVLKEHPEAKVVASQKCTEFLQDLLHIPAERFKPVGDHERLSLGNKTLEFIHTPWVHWPETIVTYLQEDKILFSCDFFGSHIAGSDLYADDEAKVLSSAKRYYAEIMMPFRAMIKINLEKLSGIDIRLIAPSHGPVHDNPSLILNAYREWTSDAVKNEAVIAYVSMHGSTEIMVNRLTEGLIKRGITVRQFDLPKTDIGEVAMALVDAVTIVVATPTVLAGPHPQAVYAAYLANLLRPKLKLVAVMGSYGWGGKMVEQLAGMITNLKVEVLEPVLVKGLPREEDLLKVDALADAIAKKHSEYKLMD